MLLHTFHPQAQTPFFLWPNIFSSYILCFFIFFHLHFLQLIPYPIPLEQNSNIKKKKHLNWKKWNSYEKWIWRDAAVTITSLKCMHLKCRSCDRNNKIVLFFTRNKCTLVFFLHIFFSFWTKIGQPHFVTYFFRKQ